MSTKQYTLQAIADYVGGTVHGDPSRVLVGILPIDKASKHELTFHVSAAYNTSLSKTDAAVILHANALPLCSSDAIVCESPYLAYAKVAHLFMPKPEIAISVHPSACIHPTAQIAPSCSIAANVVIGANVSLGDNVIIHAGVVIGDRCVLGKGCRIMANVTLYHDCFLDEGVTIHSGTIIGSEGFGHAQDANKHWVPIPQLGKVLIGKNTEIGANTTIDRGALDNTVIGMGVMIDNLVHIAHNVIIGDHTAIAACVGIAGSVTIGKYCQFAGQVGISGHLEIGDNVILLARCAVSKSILKPGIYSGLLPCQERKTWNKNAVRFRRLNKLFKNHKKEEVT